MTMRFLKKGILAVCIVGAGIAGTLAIVSARDGEDRGSSRESSWSPGAPSEKGGQERFTPEALLETLRQRIQVPARKERRAFLNRERREGETDMEYETRLGMIGLWDKLIVQAGFDLTPEQERQVLGILADGNRMYSLAIDEYGRLISEEYVPGSGPPPYQPSEDVERASPRHLAPFLHEEVNRRIEKVLTPEQMARWRKIPTLVFVNGIEWIDVEG